MKHESLLISTADAAKLLGMQPQTLRKWAIYENGPVTPKTAWSFVVLES